MVKFHRPCDRSIGLISWMHIREYSIGLVMHEILYGLCYVSFTFHVCWFWRFEIFGFFTLEIYISECSPTLALTGSHKGCISIYVDSVKKFANINRTNTPHVLMWVMIYLGPLRKLDYMHAIWLKKLIIYLIYFSIKQNYKFQVWHIPNLNLLIWYHEIWEIDQWLDCCLKDQW